MALSTSERLEPLPTEPLAFLYGPYEVVEGYYDLEAHERNQQNVAIAEQNEAVTLWYRALTLYRRAALLNWSISASEAGEPDAAELVQMELLGLGVSSMKAALDALLAGYYSVAFGIIRHMLESFVQFVYVIYFPKEARRWCRQPGGVQAQPKSPGMLVMCRAVQKAREVRGERLDGLINEIYDSWSLMSKGSHPTGAGLFQTEGESDRHHLIGATYRPDLCLVGFDAGLVAVAHLLPMALMWAKPAAATEEWQFAWNDLRNRMDAWREAHRAEIDAAIGAKPSGVPVPSRDEAEECGRLIQAWQDDINRQRRPLHSGT